MDEDKDRLLRIQRARGVDAELFRHPLKIVINASDGNVCHECPWTQIFLNLDI
jgi:hypothetical protein